MKPFIRVMKALSDPSRVRILKLLETGELCVCEIKDVLGLAQSTTSKHMKLLEDAGLVDRRRQGSWILHTLAANPESVYAETMLENLGNWLTEDAELSKMHKLLPTALVQRDCRNN